MSSVALRARPESENMTRGCGMAGPNCDGEAVKAEQRAKTLGEIALSLRAIALQLADLARRIEKLTQETKGRR